MDEGGGGPAFVRVRPVFSATNWWTRSPNTNNSNNVWNVNSDGDYNNWNYNNTNGVRPALMGSENE